MESSHCVRLHPFAFGVAAGVTWGLGILFVGLLAWWFGYGLHFQETIASIYIGYDTSLQGVILGTLWALIDGFVAGVIFGYIYNIVRRCCCKKCEPNQVSN